MTGPAPSGDEARVSVTVAVEPAEAFDVLELELELDDRQIENLRVGATGC